MTNIDTGRYQVSRVHTGTSAHSSSPGVNRPDNRFLNRVLAMTSIDWKLTNGLLQHRSTKDRSGRSRMLYRWNTLRALWKSRHLQVMLRSPVGIILSIYLHNSAFSGVFSPPFFSYWHGNSAESVLDAVRRIKAIMVDAGPFDGAFWLSEGGAALLSTLVQDKLHSFGLKFILLFVPTPLFDPSGHRRFEISQTRKPIVEIPTIFVTGEHDQLKPLTKPSQGLLSREKTLVLERTGAHVVPNSSESSVWERVIAEILASTSK